MKRLRDELHTNPPIKRPFSPSRGESYGPSHPPTRSGGGGGGGGGASRGGGGGIASSNGLPKMTTDDALSYLKQVRDKFQNEREKYDRFLQVMKDFKAARISTSGVTARVKELFKGHPNLILGFNRYLPKGYEITLTDEDEAPSKMTIEFDEAISFVNKIKKRFQNDDRVYKSFLNILNMYRKEHKDITEVYQEVAALFRDHQDLVDEFTRFLPENSVAAPHASLRHHSITRHDERSSALPKISQSHIDKQRQRTDIKVELKGERDLSVDLPDMDGDKSAVKLQKEQKKHMEREIRDKRNRETDDKDHDVDNNGDDSMHRHSDKKKTARKVEDFASNSSLALYGDKDALKNMYRQEFAFCEKVKERLQSGDEYQAFLKFLHIYSTEIITRTELQSLIGDLLGKYPDLMEGFNEFMERCEKIDGFLADVMGKKSLWNEGNSSKPLRIMEKEKERKRDVEGGKERERYNMKYWGKSIQELDLTNCQRCTPSYRLLHDDYPMSAASQRSDLGDEVLNDCWVSVTSGSEDYSFKHMRRNQYEESLFRCEDDRFELDMLLESVSSSAKIAEELLNSINNNSISQDGPLRIVDHFKGLKLRCIERIYGDHGLDVIDILKKNPSIALPVILIRLKQKQEEWTKCRTDFNKVWAEIYSKNHYKSLDHRSFYFKQQDSKNLSTKSLVAEIREIKEKTQKEDYLLLSIAAGSRRHSIIPNMEFEYADNEVHEDVYKIIEYSCEELCATKEQLNKSLMLWTTFLEPMMGIPSRHQGSEDAEEYDASKRYSPNDNAADGHGANSSRLNNDLIMKGNEAKSTTDGMISLVDGKATAGSNQLVNGDFIGSSVNPKHREDLADPWNNEKEEGELSPTGDFEDNFGTYKDNTSHSLSDKIHSNEAMEVEMRSSEEICADRTGENDVADANGQDSENNADAAEDASGSESAADECSREEHEEEEDKEESEGEAEHSSENEGDGGASLSQSERFVLTCKPLSKHVDSTIVVDGKKGMRVFYGNDSFYVLFRLHQCLYERILSAKVRLANGESKWRTTTDANSDDPYDRFMNALFNLLDGSYDNAKFEDDCRSLFGNNSYMLFTLDKLIYKLVKQLQTVSSEEVDCKLIQLYEYESFRKPEKYIDSVYYENVHVFLHDENIYRLQCVSSPTCLSIQLMDDGHEKSEVVSVSIDPKFSTYLHKDFLSVAHGKKESSATMLKRNMRKYANLDESTALSMATENVLIVNGLECKMAAVSSKISYVLDTEDSFVRCGRRKNKSPEKSSAKENAKVQKFHQFLAAA